MRRALGLSQEEFSAGLGPEVGVKALGAWEIGAREPRGAVSIAKRIEVAYGVPATWLLGLDVPTGPNGPNGGESAPVTWKERSPLQVVVAA